MTDITPKQSSSLTIPFIPDRLNRKPPVYRGMTFYELLLMIVIGSSSGGVIGMAIMLILNISWASIPIGMLIVGVIAVRFGGFYISRLKRGRPEAWLERYVELRLHPSKFIHRDHDWSIRRSKNKNL